VFGKRFYQGSPCFYLRETCTIYKDKPLSPCGNYNCLWKTENILPEWMRPDLVNVVVTYKKSGDIEYYEITEAGNRLDVRVLNWLMHWGINEKKNLRYYIDGGVNYLGSVEFVRELDKTWTK
jgi:hypothetical protein